MNYYPKKEKAKLLIIPNGTSVPDPLTLKYGWVTGKQEYDFLVVNISE